MNRNEKNNSQSSNSNSDSQAGIVIPVRYVGIVAASTLILLATIFMGGYFWGKKQSAEAFCKNIERDSLADQIFVALCGAADSKEVQPEMDEVVEEQETTVLVAGDSQNSDQAVLNGIITTDKEVVARNSSELEPCPPQNTKSSLYQAELIGFGTLPGAKRFAQRLREKHHVAVTVKKRTSKTAKGRVVTWYQVVTGDYTNENELVALVNTIKQQERLNDVRIVNHCGQNT